MFFIFESYLHGSGTHPAVNILPRNRVLVPCLNLHAACCIDAAEPSNQVDWPNRSIYRAAEVRILVGYAAGFTLPNCIVELLCRVASVPETCLLSINRSSHLTPASRNMWPDVYYYSNTITSDTTDAYKATWTNKEPERNSIALPTGTRGNHINYRKTKQETKPMARLLAIGPAKTPNTKQRTYLGRLLARLELLEEGAESVLLLLIGGAVGAFRSLVL